MRLTSDKRKLLLCFSQYSFFSYSSLLPSSFFLCSSSACCYVLSNISNNFCEKLFNEYLNYVSYNISTICDREQRKSFIRKSIIRDWFYFFSKAEKFLCERFILSLTFKVFHSRSLIIINTWLYNFAKVTIFWFLGLHEYFFFCFLDSLSYKKEPDYLGCICTGFFFKR